MAREVAVMDSARAEAVGMVAVEEKDGAATGVMAVAMAMATMCSPAGSIQMAWVPRKGNRPTCPPARVVQGW
jgi:hypothetical protein